MTPFEMCELAIEVQAPLFIFRQWHRHRTFSYNEFSARYSKMPDMHFLPGQDEFRLQDTNNKQAGSDTTLSDKISIYWHIKLKHEQDSIQSNYNELLQDNVARELARINTPVSRYSKMRAKGNLRNWLHFLNLRMDHHAQKEIRDYANAVAKIIEALWPRTYNLFLEHTFHAKKLNRTEAAALKELLHLIPHNFKTKNDDNVYTKSIKSIIKKLEVA